MGGENLVICSYYTKPIMTLDRAPLAALVRSYCDAIYTSKRRPSSSALPPSFSVELRATSSDVAAPSQVPPSQYSTHRPIDALLSNLASCDVTDVSPQAEVNRLKGARHMRRPTTSVTRTIAIWICGFVYRTARCAAGDPSLRRGSLLCWCV